MSKSFSHLKNLTKPMSTPIKTTQGVVAQCEPTIMALLNRARAATQKKTLPIQNPHAVRHPTAVRACAGRPQPKQQTYKRGETKKPDSGGN
jgi:hypothetical protein